MNGISSVWVERALLRRMPDVSAVMGCWYRWLMANFWATFQAFSCLAGWLVHLA